MAYSDTGSGSPVVLLVHGFPLNRSMWDPQIGVLRGSGARVIAPDLRGFGASEAGPPGPLTMEQHADDLVALLDALGIVERVLFVGLSMGGYVAFAFWRRHSERVRAFVLADTRAAPDAPQQVIDREAMARAVEDAHSPEPSIKNRMPRMFSRTLRQGAPVERQVEAMMASTSPRAVADGERALALRVSSFATLPTISVPTLVIVGEHDQLTPPSDSAEIVSGVPGARLVTIDQAGHMSNMENPAAFNDALVSFLESLS